MEPDSSKRKKTFNTKKSTPNKKVKNEKGDEEEELNEQPSHEDLENEEKVPLESIPEPEYDENEVFLSWYDSDLNLIIDDNFTAASPLHQKGFSYLQAGARATYGFFSGKVCFEVKVLQYCKLKEKDGHLNTHLLRVGWSPRKASLALGSDHKSYGYDNTGRTSTIGEIVDYGKTFSIGDVVGAYLDIGKDKITISYTVNGEDMGVAYEIPQRVIQKEPLFPHILTKNVSYECNFGKEKPWFPPKEDFTFAANVPKVLRIAGPRRPKTQAECEVILMVGLPNSGKTTWVNEFREKHPGMYYVIDTNALIDRMELMNPKRETIILRKTKVLGRLLGIAMDRRRNYILDQVNVIRAEQVRKLGFFSNHKRRVVSVVIPDEELRKRNKTLNGEDSARIMKLKAQYRLPTMSCPQISEVADSVEFVGLPFQEALKLVKSYNREAWKRGFKPDKDFWKASQACKEKKEKMKENRMMSGMADHRETDFRGSGGWSSPLRARDTGEWAPPPRNRSGQEWQPLARNREWHSPSRQGMSGDWLPGPRGRTPELWPPPESNNPACIPRSPSEGRIGEGWVPDSRNAHFSKTSPRSRPRTRWGPPREEQSPPLNRMEEWQPRRARSPGPRNSPPRRRPDMNVRYSDHHSPPGNRSEEFPSSRNRFPAEDPVGSWQHNERGRPVQRNPGRDNWPSQERLGEFTPQEVRGRSSFPQDMQLEGNFPPEHRRDSDMPHCESRLSGSLPPHEADFGGGFPPRGGMMGGPAQRMDNEFPPQEGRFSGNIMHKNEKVGEPLHQREGRMGSDFSSRDQRVGGAFPPREGGFPPQDCQFGPEHVPFEERENMPPFEGRMRRGFSPHSRKGHDYPPSERRMVMGLSIRDRLGEKFDDVPPQEVRPTRSLSPRERMMGDILPNEDRIHSDVPPHGTRMDDFQHRRGRIDDRPPHVGRMEDDTLTPVGRVGGNLLPYEERMGDSASRGGRRIGNLPPQEHRIGDLPPNEGRMGGRFSPGDILPSRGSRRGDFAHQEDITGYPIPHHDRHGANLPPHGDRMGGEWPLERTNDDFPFHEGRIGHGDLREREISDMSRGGRMSGDVAHGGGMSGDMPHGGRMSGDMPHGGRMSGDMPHGGRMSGDMPHGGRMSGDMPHGGRMSGDMPHGGRMSGDMPHGGRMSGDMPHGGRMSGDMPHGGRMSSDMPHGGRMSGDMPHGGRMSGDIPHGGRMSGDIPHGGRMSGDMPHGGRMSGDLPHGGRVGGDVPQGGKGDDISSHRGRMITDMPPSGDRVRRDLPHGGKVGEFPPNSGGIDRDLPYGGRVRGEDFISRGGKMSVDLSPRERIVNDRLSRNERIGGDMPPLGGRHSGDLSPIEGRLGEMPTPGGKPRDDIPFFVERHGDFTHQGGRPDGDMPHHGRLGGDLPSDGGRHSGDFPSHRGRFNADVPSCGGQLGGDLPPLGGRLGDDLPPYRGRIVGDLPQEVGVPVDPREGRSSSSDHWNSRLPPNSEGPRNFEWIGDQDLGPNKGNINRNSGLPLPQDRCEGGGPSGDWKPPDNSLSDRASLPSNQQLQHPLDNRDRVNNASHFLDNKRVSPNRAPHKWPSPSRARRPGSPSPSRPRRQSSSPNRPRRRSPSPNRPRRRSPSPNRTRRRSPSPNRPRRRSPSPNRPRRRSPSPNRPRRRSPSPSRPRRRSPSPNRPRRRSPSPNRPRRRSPSPNRPRRRSPSPNRPRRRSPSPLGRNRLDQHSLRQNFQHPGGEQISPRQPVTVQQTPVDRSDRRSPEGRHGNRQQSPPRATGGSWQPAGGMHGDDWQILERGDRIGPSNRLPPMIDRGHHSPPRKQQRLETNLDNRPSGMFVEGSDGRDSGAPVYQQLGNPNVPLEPSNRDLRDRILSGLEQHGPTFNPRLPDSLNPGGLGGQFLVKDEGPVSKSGVGHWQNPDLGTPREGWQSPGGGGDGSRWERVKEEEEELAPYEIPFNQADWDSNDPNAGILHSTNEYRPRMNHSEPINERSRGNPANRNQEACGPLGNKSRGSVWQRVGGYVNDEKESNLREPRGSNRYPDRSSSGRGERGHRGIERDNKERSREFEENRNRRGRDK